ncbi:MAG: hypothetical protein V7K77_10770 [Nostoc sp.]|uniref:hypothetical protein n=1 Tax=Nostoc sp. TaxID=1180 RepID=UPI002FFC22D2
MLKIIIDKEPIRAVFQIFPDDSWPISKDTYVHLAIAFGSVMGIDKSDRVV